MNSSIATYLVSPVSRLPLQLAGTDALGTEDGTTEFPIVEGIPLLLPPGQFAEWYPECLEVIFQEKSAETLSRMSSPDGEEWSRNLNRVLREDYGPDGVREAFGSYAKLSRSERMRGFVKLSPSQCSAEHPMIQQRALEARRRYATVNYARQHSATLKNQLETWAFHGGDYAAAVLDGSPDTVVELGTGACLGTLALMEGGFGLGRLITMDVDYACLGNPEGLAKLYGVQDRVDGIAASFWFLPFRDSSIDVVCSHYGIDESRETSRIVEEVARVLAPGGRFVAVVRTDGAYRPSLYIGQLGFSVDEIRELAWMADLFPGTDRLIEIARRNGLALEKRRTITPESAHQRDILLLRKGEDARYDA